MGSRLYTITENSLLDPICELRIGRFMGLLTSNDTVVPSLAGQCKVGLFTITISTQNALPNVRIEGMVVAKRNVASS